MMKINQEEYETLKRLEGDSDDWKWLVRNSAGSDSEKLYMYSEKPYKDYDAGVWTDGNRYFILGSRAFIVDDYLFQFIQWEDEEPHNIAELIGEYESEEKEVKKDIEWLKEELNYFIKSEVLDEREIGFELAIGEVIDLLNQLDESEVLSEYWIEQKSIDTHVDTLSGEVQVTFRLDDLENLLVPNQEEVTVGREDAENIVQYKKMGWTLSHLINDYGEDARHDELLAKAWLDYPNIKVEEEQKYVVRLNRGAYKPVFIALDKISNHIHYVESHDYNKENLRVHLNEREIRALDDGDVLFKHFAVRVEELEE